MRKTSGVSLMLLIFLSLCLIIFSLLSLSGAVADETLSSQAADRTTEYYAAVTSANNLLAQIDLQLAAYLKEAEAANEADASKASSSDPETAGTTSPGNKNAANHAENSGTKQKETAYLQLCSQIGKDIPNVSWEDDLLAFSVNVNEDQILQIKLTISYPTSDDDTLYCIHTWKIVNTSDWNADTSMNLFRSEDLS